MEIFEKDSWNLTEEYKKTWELTPLNCVPQLFRALLAIVSGSGTEILYFWADRQWQWLKGELSKTDAAVVQIGEAKISSETYIDIGDTSFEFGQIKGYGGIWAKAPNLSETNWKIRLANGEIYSASYPKTGKLNKGYSIVNKVTSSVNEMPKVSYICALNENPPKLYYFKNEGKDYFYFELTKVENNVSSKTVTGKLGQLVNGQILTISNNAKKETLNAFGLENVNGYHGVITTQSDVTIVAKDNQYFFLSKEQDVKFNGTITPGTYVVVGDKFYYYQKGDTYQVYDLKKNESVSDIKSEWDL